MTTLRDPAALADAIDPRKARENGWTGKHDWHPAPLDLQAASDLLRTLSTPTESHRLAAEEIEEMFRIRTRSSAIVEKVAAIIAKHCAPLPSGGDEWLEKAAMEA